MDLKKLPARDPCVSCDCTHKLLRCTCPKDTLHYNVAPNHKFKPEIKVGTGVTIYVGSDRYPGTIIETWNDRHQHLKVRYDDYALVSGSIQSEEQVFEFFEKSDDDVLVFSRRKDGRWVERFASRKNGRSLSIGFRDAYFDPSY